MNGALELVGLAVDGDLPLLHALEQRRLRLGRGAVDLVADDDVREDRSRLELEVAVLLLVDGDAGDVAGSRSGVNCTRRTVPSIDRASALASMVLPTPGTSSTSRCPSASRTVTASRTASPLPSRTVDGGADLRCGADESPERRRAPSYMRRAPCRVPKSPPRKGPACPGGAGVPRDVHCRRRRLRRRLLTVCVAAKNAPRRTSVPLRNLSNRAPNETSPSSPITHGRARIEEHPSLPNGSGFLAARSTTPDRGCGSGRRGQHPPRRASWLNRAQPRAASLQPRAAILLPPPDTAAPSGVMGDAARRAQAPCSSPTLPHRTLTCGFVEEDLGGNDVWTGVGGGMWSTVGRGGVR